MRLLSKFRIWVAMAVGVLSVSSAGLAQAATLVATYTGKVAGFTDSEGFFGAAGEVLDGDAFVASFTYDPSLGAISPFKMDGGPYWGLPEMMSATLTINGETWNFGGQESRVEIFPDHIAHYTTGTTGWLGFGVATTNGPADYFSPMPLTFDPGGSYGGLMANNVAYGFRLNAESVQITSAIPEPGAWALMIAGFGLAGAALRRRPPRQALT